MQAAFRKKYGSADVIKLDHFAQPIAQDNEVLVRVHCTTVNRTDCANLTAKPFIMRFILGLLKPRKIFLGTDFSGEIISKGKKVTSFEIGDRVVGFKDLGAGSHAEFIAVAEKDVFHIPKSIDYRTAAASLEGAHYAHSSIHRSTIQSGQKILINGASGAIGSALLQLLSPYHVEITATCSTKNIELITSLGATKVYDYTKEDFTTYPDAFDFIFDAVGKSTFRRCKPLLKERGVYISSELGPYAQNLFYALLAPFSSKKVKFPIPFSTQTTIPYILKKLENSIFNPVIDAEYAFEEIVEAYDYVLKGNKTGNVVLQVIKEI